MLRHLGLSSLSLFFGLLAHADPISLTSPLPDGVLQARTCMGQAGAVLEGYRPRLENGQYGPCVITKCGDAYDLVQGKCRPVQKAFFNVPSKTIVLKPGETKVISIQTKKPVSEGSLSLQTDSNDLTLSSNTVNFSNESEKFITLTAAPVQEESLVHLNLQKGSGKIDVQVGQQLIVKIEPDGLPKLKSFSLSKETPSTDDQSVNLTLSFSKPFSQVADTKLTFDISGNKALLAQANVRKITLVVAKGASGAVLSVPLSQTASQQKVRFTLNSQALSKMDLNGQEAYKEFLIEASGPCDYAKTDPVFHAQISHDFLDGQGPVSAYLVCTKQEILQISSFSNGNFVLGKNIDLEGTNLGIDVFSGKFDGQGFSLSGCALYFTGQVDRGCFSNYSSYALIRNLTLTNPVGVSSDGNNIAALIGQAYHSTIESITVSNPSFAISSIRLAGVIGYNWYSTLSNNVVSGGRLSGAGTTEPIVADSSPSVPFLDRWSLNLNPKWTNVLINGVLSSGP